MRKWRLLASCSPLLCHSIVICHLLVEYFSVHCTYGQDQKDVSHKTRTVYDVLLQVIFFTANLLKSLEWQNLPTSSEGMCSIGNRQKGEDCCLMKGSVMP